MTSPTLLIIEDDHKMRRLLELILAEEGYKITSAAGGEAGIQRLKETSYDLILSDLQMDRVDGMQILEYAKKNHPDTPVLIITGFGSVKSAVEAMRKGALDYITKPIDNEELIIIIRKALEFHHLTNENKRLSQGLKQKYSFDRIIGDSPPIRNVKQLGREVSGSDSTVLISGESGTGKELFARAIHYHSNRSRYPMITINCAAIPENLLESELFGYEKGAFTDAKFSKPGRFLTANRGTIFLDEISEMSLQTQVKILRVLQEKEIEALGSTKTTKIDIRIIAATNKDLPEMIQKGLFREDLFYRLNVFPLLLPPLRERNADIRTLAAYFIEAYNKKMGKRFKGFSESALDILQSYQWPGNIRELQNIVERVLITCKRDLIQAEDLPVTFAKGPLLQTNTTSLLSLGLSIETLEKKAILEALEKTRGNVSDASKLLGVTRNTLRYRIQKHGIHT